MAAPKTIGGRYEIQEPPIGQGGMGVVFKAYDTVTKRFVAVKTLWGALEAVDLQLFEKEWTVLARLSHPNIVDILDTGDFNDNGQHKPYFVMPLLPGLTLDKLIKTASQRLTAERTVEIIAQACRGLQAAHDQGLVHRDLKPSNIFVMDDDTVKIIDFGVVHLADARTVTGIKGTLQYMAPEQLEMKPATPASDIFSLGVVSYEALTGRKPFGRKSESEVVEAIRTYVPPPASEINSSVNAMVSRTVHKAMAKAPYHRFSNAREFADTLQRALRNEHIERFDRAKIQPRIDRMKKAFAEGDNQFALEILTELESEGNIDPEMSLLRIQIEQAMRSKTVRQLLESARTRMEEDEFPLALQKIQSVLDIDSTNVDALSIKSQIERQRGAKQVDNWFRLAQQHLDNQLFVQARQAIEEVLKIDTASTRAREVLSDIDKREFEFAKIRDEKQKIYESALTSYRNGEISTALSKLERVLDLSRSISKGNPQTDAQYQILYNQIRSERDALHNAYAEGHKALDDGNYQKALDICDESLTKRPGDPMFQALKIEVDEAQRQQQSADVAEINNRVEAENDLDRKLNILKEAAEKYPNERLFTQSLKLIKERRDLVNSIVGRARHYEEMSQFNEAIGQWDILRNIYGVYPGLDFEVERLNRRRADQAHEETKLRWVEKIDRHMASGEYDRAGQTAVEAATEFPGDGELTRLEKLAGQAAKKAAEAHVLLEEGQQLCAAKRHVDGIQKLREALALDEKNPVTRAALLSALLEHARSVVGTDWHGAVPFINEALEIDESDPVAKSLSSLVADYERREAVDACLTQARDYQAAGDLDTALSTVEQGLAGYPNEIRLSQLYGTLRSAIEAQRPETRRRMEPPSGGADATISLTSGTQRTGGSEETVVSLPASSPRVEAGSETVVSVPKAAANPEAGAETVLSLPEKAAPTPAAPETVVPPGLGTQPLAASTTPPPFAPIEPAASEPTPVPPAPPSVTPPPPPAGPPPMAQASGPIPAPPLPKGKDKGKKDKRDKSAAPPAPPAGPPDAPDGAKKKPWAVIGGVAAVLVLGGGFLAFKLLRPGNTPAVVATGQVSVQLIGNVPNIRFQVDGQPIAGGDISLAPGNHQAIGLADGYQPDHESFTVPATATAPFKVNFALQVALPELRVTSDLKTAKLVLDSAPPADLQDGGLLLQAIPSGEHKLRIIDGGKDVFSFPFKVEEKSLVTLTGPVQTLNTPGVIVSSLGGSARIYATSGIQGGLPDKPAAPIPADGLLLNSIAPGSNDFVVYDGKAQNHVTIDSSTVPVLSVQLGAARDVGSIIVESNVPDADLSIDGAPYRHGLSGGSRLLTLAPKTYVIKVSKAGYQDAPAQSVDLKKGDQKSARFDLVALPRKSALTVDGAPADTEILVDGNHLGNTSASGAFSGELNPGAHTIVLRKAGYEDLTVNKDAQSGALKIAAGKMVKMPPGSISIHVTPANAKISYHRVNETVAQSAANGQTVSVRPGDYEVAAAADGYYQRTATVTVASGKTANVELTLDAEKKAINYSQSIDQAFEKSSDWIENGGWWHHTVSGYSWLKHDKGDFTIAILKQQRRGIFKSGFRADWVVDYRDNARIEYWLDDKTLHRRYYSDTGNEPEFKAPHEAASGTFYRVEILIEPEQVVVKVENQVVDTFKRPSPAVPLGKFGFKGAVDLLVQGIR